MHTSDLFGRVGIAVASALASLAVVALLHLILRRVARSRPGMRATVERTNRPALALALFIVVRVTVLGSWDPTFSRAVSAGLVMAVAWLVGTILLGVEDFALQRYRTDATSDAPARRLHTQISIMRRVTIAVITVLGIGTALMTFPEARAIGASLLASAGVVGVVAALAAQSTLGNLFAGLTLAFGNALRLDDVVVVQGEWGRILEITLTYVVVRIWDQRNLILPSSYFTSTPFENWTRWNAEIIGTVEMDVDWTLPVDEMRTAAREVVEGSDRWDGREYRLQVTQAVGGLVRVRILVSAADSASLWDLRCLIREEMVAWLRKNHPYALPRTRTNVDGTFFPSAPADLASPTLTPTIPAKRTRTRNTARSTATGLEMPDQKSSDGGISVPA